MMSQKPKFEKQMERLQKIVEELERGDLPLEKGVLLYKEGQALALSCRGQLEKARNEVTIRNESGGNDSVISPFDGADIKEEDEE
jgi:exodeoxyribonuclease VII small subunit